MWFTDVYFLPRRYRDAPAEALTINCDRITGTRKEPNYFLFADNQPSDEPILGF
jgi:hypothetical protein